MHARAYGPPEGWCVEYNAVVIDNCNIAHVIDLPLLLYIILGSLDIFCAVHTPNPLEAEYQSKPGLKACRPVLELCFELIRYSQESH